MALDFSPLNIWRWIICGLGVVCLPQLKAGVRVKSGGSPGDSAQGCEHFGWGRPQDHPAVWFQSPPVVGEIITWAHNPSFTPISFRSAKNKDHVPKMNFFFHTKYKPLLILMEKKKEKKQRHTRKRKKKKWNSIITGFLKPQPRMWVITKTVISAFYVFLILGSSFISFQRGQDLFLFLF